MAEDQVKNVASKFIDEVINGVNSEMSKGKLGGKNTASIGCDYRQRSLLCVLFSPSRLWNFLNIILELCYR